VIKHGSCLILCSQHLLPVQAHWADQVVLGGVAIPAKQAKVEAAARPNVNFYVYAGADHLTTATAAVQHWHFHLAY
jgi:hypothetical protein